MRTMLTMIWHGGEPYIIVLEHRVASGEQNLGHWMRLILEYVFIFRHSNTVQSTNKWVLGMPGNGTQNQTEPEAPKNNLDYIRRSI